MDHHHHRRKHQQPSSKNAALSSSSSLSLSSLPTRHGSNNNKKGKGKGKAFLFALFLTGSVLLVALNSYSSIIVMKRQEMKQQQHQNEERSDNPKPLKTATLVNLQAKKLQQQKQQQEQLEQAAQRLAQVAQKAASMASSNENVLQEEMPPWTNIVPNKGSIQRQQKKGLYLDQCHKTTVTAVYYELNKNNSKDNSKDKEQYRKWIKAVLQRIGNKNNSNKNNKEEEDCLVIFGGTKDILAAIQQVRPKRKTVLVQLEAKDLPIAHVGNSNDHAETSSEAAISPFWQNQNQPQDVLYHSFVDLSLTWFVKEAIRQDFFESKWFQWKDIIENDDDDKSKKNGLLDNNDGVFWFTTNPNPRPTQPFLCTRTTEQRRSLSAAGAVADQQAWQNYHRQYAATMDLVVAAAGQSPSIMTQVQLDCLLQITCQRQHDLCRFRDSDDNDNSKSILQIPNNSIATTR